MKLITYNELRNIIHLILLRLNFSDKDADLIANHLATSDLLGHHSHGVIRLPEYCQRIRHGAIDPQANITYEDVSPNITFVDGDNGLGQLASIFAANLAIDKAKRAGLTTVGINTTNHTGRIGAYVEQIAKANMLGIYFCNGNSKLKIMAPYGGKDAKIAANPLAFAAPRRANPPIVLDMATTAIAQGKVLHARNKKEQVATDCLLDAEGDPTCDPLDYLNGGSLLPFGGKQAYKGFGIALIVEIFAGILSRAKMISKDMPQDNNAAFMIAFNIESFLPLDSYFAEIETLCTDIKTSRIRDGFEEILLPGQRSNNTAEEQRKHGIQIDPCTWQNIKRIAKDLGINIET